MKRLKLKANSKQVNKYYDEIKNLAQLNLFGEGAVSPHFAGLLRYCAGQFDWTLSEQHVMKRGKRSIRPDGALLDRFSMVCGVWEAKDKADKEWRFNNLPIWSYKSLLEMSLNEAFDHIGFFSIMTLSRKKSEVRDHETEYILRLASLSKDRPADSDANDS